MRIAYGAAALLLVAAACAPAAVPAPRAASSESTQRYYVPPREAAWADALPSRRRLSETRVLGAGEEPSYTDARVWVPRTHGLPYAPPQPVVIVTPPSYGFGYGGSFAGRGGPPRAWSANPGTRPYAAEGRSGTPPIGGNWAPPPNNGPAFPFSAAPAPPFR